MSTCRLLALPAELREIIWKLAFPHEEVPVTRLHLYRSHTAIGLLRACRLTYHEARSVFLENSVFRIDISVSTPRPPPVFEITNVDGFIRCTVTSTEEEDSYKRPLHEFLEYSRGGLLPDIHTIHFASIACPLDSTDDADVNALRLAVRLDMHQYTNSLYTCSVDPRTPAPRTKLALKIAQEFDGTLKLAFYERKITTLAPHDIRELVGTFRAMHEAKE